MNADVHLLDDQPCHVTVDFPVEVTGLYQSNGNCCRGGEAVKKLPECQSVDQLPELATLRTSPCNEISGQTD